MWLNDSRCLCLLDFCLGFMWLWLDLWYVVVAIVAGWLYFGRYCCDLRCDLATRFGRYLIIVCLWFSFC